MRQPRVGVVRQGRGVERLRIAIQSALPPGEDRQHPDDDRSHDLTESDRVAVRARPPTRPAGGNQRQHADQRQVLIVVGDQRVLLEPDVAKAHHRDQHGAEVDPRDQHPALPTLPSAPQQQPGDQRRRQSRQPPPEVGRLHVPLRVDEAQIERQQRLVEIEPHHATRSQQALQRPAELRGRCRRPRLVPGVHQHQARPDHDERRDACRVAPRQRPLPGDHRQRRQWHGADRALAQHGEHEGDQTAAVPPPGARQIAGRVGRLIGA
jgi:hypothetical protein